MQYAAFVAASSVMQHMQPHLLANFLRQIWLDLGKIKNLASPKNSISNLASPKNSISYGYAKVSFIPRQYSWDRRHEHDHTK